jgi:hypothetical protein
MTLIGKTKKHLPRIYADERGSERQVLPLIHTDNTDRKKQIEEEKDGGTTTVHFIPRHLFERQVRQESPGRPAACLL